MLVPRISTQPLPALTLYTYPTALMVIPCSIIGFGLPV